MCPLKVRNKVVVIRRKILICFTIFLLLTSYISPIIQAADFPMKNLNERRTNYIQDHLFPYIKTDLIAPSGELKNTDSTPIIVNDISYTISTSTGKVVAYDLGNEKTLWISSSLGNLKSHASNSVVVGNNLVVPAGDSIVVLNKNTGAKIKEIFTSVKGRTNAFAAGPLPWRDGDVYFGSKNQKVYGINASDGSIFPFMSYETGGTITSSPTLLTRGSSGDRIVIGVNSWPGKMVILNPHSRGVAGTKQVTYSLPTAAVSPDGYKAHFVDVFGRIVTYNGSNDSVSVVNGVHNVFGTNGIVARMPALDEKDGYVTMTINHKNNGWGYIYRVNPATGAHSQVYKSSAGIASGPTTLSNGTILFTRNDGYIIGRYENGNSFAWYSGGKSNYKMPRSTNFGRITVGGGDKKVILTNGTDGIHVFEPDFPNLRAVGIKAVDGSGKSKTTFKDNEKIIIRGSFKNDGPKAVNNVEHIATKDGRWQDYKWKNYSSNGTQSVDQEYSSLTPGTYTFTFKSDPNNKMKESNENDNNTSAITITVVSTKPDLEGQETKAFNSAGNEQYTFEYGEPVSITGYVKNIGDGAASGVKNTHSFNGVLQGNVKEADFAINEKIGISKTYNNLEPGTYKVFSISDYTNTISEKNEGNNRTSEISFTVKEPPKPDLKGTATKVLDQNGNEKYEFTEGETIVVRGYVKNESLVDINFGVEHGQYLNGVFQEVDYTPTYPINQTRWVSKTYKSLSAGTYKVYTVGDPNNILEETNESNNSTPTVTFKVKAQPMPDIAAESTKAYDVNGNERYVYNYGEKIEFRAKFRNIGDAPIGDTYEHQVYVNGKATPNLTYAGYTNAQSRWIKRWFGNDIEPTNNQYAKPLQPGVYEVYAIADPDNKFVESSKQNNKGAKVTITVNAPDIRGTYIRAFNPYIPSVSKTTFRPNEFININAAFKNIGKAPASNVTHATYVDGVEVSTRKLDDYAVGGNNGFTSSLGKLPRGTHTIEMVADPDKEIQKGFDISRTPTVSFPYERFFTFKGESKDKFKFTDVQINESTGELNTAEFWMYWDGTEEGMPIAFDRYSLYFKDGLFGFNTGSGDVIGTPSSKLKNKWVHISAVFVNGDLNIASNKSKLKLYVNGVSQPLTTKFTTTEVIHRLNSFATKDVHLSGWNHSDHYLFSGKLAEVRLWDHERTNQQVFDHMNTVVEGNEEGLVLHAVPTINNEKSTPFEQAYRFDRDVESSFTLDNIPVNTNEGAKNTVEFWMKWDGTGNNIMPLGFHHYDLYFLNGFFGINTGHGDLIGISDSNLKNKWVHVAAVFYNGDLNAERDQVKLYINGVEQELTTTFTTFPDHRSPATVANKLTISGWTTTDGYKFNGEMAEIRVWDHERTVQDIQENMNKSLTGFETGLAAIMSPHTYSIELDHSSKSYNASQLAVNTSSGGENTVEFWMKWDGVGNSFPISFDNGTYNLIFNDSQQCFGLNTTWGDCIGVVDSTIYESLKNRWVFVSVVLPNGIPTTSNVAIYLNGEKQTLTQLNTSGYNTVNSKVTSTMKIGGQINSNNSHQWGGEITDIRVWNHKRTTSQIQKYMGIELRGNESNLVGFWSPDETSTGSLYDQRTSSNGRPTNHAMSNGFTSTEQIYYQTSKEGLEVMWKPLGANTTYKLYRDGTLIYNGTNNAYFDKNVIKGISYNYSLKVVSQYGESLEISKLAEYTTNSVEMTIQVVGTPPVADFDVTTPKYENEVVSFTNKTTEVDDDDVQYQWYKKLKTQSGSQYEYMSNLENPNEIFTVPGDYDIKLVASDPDGESVSIKSVTIMESNVVPGFSHESPYYVDQTIHVQSTAYDEDGLSITHNYKIIRPDGTNYTVTSKDFSITNAMIGEYKIEQTVTNSLGKQGTYIDYIEVRERELTAGFIHESPYYRGDLVTIISTAFGGTGSVLSYHYEITRPDETKFTSTSKGPQFTPNQVGYYLIKQTVSDQFGNSVIYEDEIQVLNRTPVADYSYNPTTIYMDTNVTFTNLSSDPDKDSLVYNWSFKGPSDTVWTDFSTIQNPSKIFAERGNWEVKLKVTDPYEDSDEVTKTIVVLNRPPVANFKTDKSNYFVGDTVAITSLATDPDGDNLSHVYKVTAPSGSVSHKTTRDFSFVANESGNYQIEQIVNDGHGGTDTVSAVVQIKELTLEGFIGHTPEWSNKHTDLGHSPDEFYSGEPFVLKGITSPSPVKSVEVAFHGTRENNQTISHTLFLNSTSDPIIFIGTYQDDSLSQPNTRLKQEPVTFTFKVIYSNGQVRTDNVTIKIIGNVYNIVKEFHKTY